jgi:hypothetical protein
MVACFDVALIHKRKFFWHGITVGRNSVRLGPYVNRGGDY